jgi:hypothetical protein
MMAVEDTRLGGIKAFFVPPVRESLWLGQVFAPSRLEMLTNASGIRPADRWPSARLDGGGRR